MCRKLKASMRRNGAAANRANARTGLVLGKAARREAILLNGPDLQHAPGSALQADADDALQRRRQQGWV
jgi:hypothetical protein